MNAKHHDMFDELLELAVPAMRPIVVRLKEIVIEVDPKAVEVVRLGDRAATFGVGPKKMTEGYAYVMPHEHWVNLGFYKGAALPDQGGLLEGTGAKMRHVKVRDLAAAEAPDLRALIIAAVAERRAAL